MGKINFFCIDSLSIKHTNQLKIYERRISAKRLQKKEAVLAEARMDDPSLERDRLHIPLPRIEKKVGERRHGRSPLVTPNQAVLSVPPLRCVERT